MCLGALCDAVVDKPVNLLLIHFVNKYKGVYRILGICRVGLIFAEFVTSSNSRKMHIVKIRHYKKSLLTALQIAKIGLSEQ